MGVKNPAVAKAMAGSKEISHTNKGVYRENQNCPQRSAYGRLITVLFLSPNLVMVPAVRHSIKNAKAKAK